MRVQFAGTGGADGWPAPGCRCASCVGVTRRPRRPTSILIDGIPLAVPGPLRSLAPTTPIERGVGANDPGGLVVRAVPGGWDITGGDGERLLCASGPGAVPEPPPDARPYDYAVLDLLADPFQLGGLRRRGLVTDTTAVALEGADHRAASEDELAENCRFWRVQRMSDGDVMRPDREGGEQGRVLVIGGARSGKSERAERRIAAEMAVTYVAAGVSAADDAEWAARVAAHRARRPSWWVTEETTDLAGVLAGTGTVLIDGVGSWLAAVMGECGAWEESDGWPVRLAERTNELVQAWRNTRCHAIAVSDEAGLGVIPGSAAGRIFRDTLGTLNQALARESEITEFVLAGRVMRLPLW